MPPDDIEAYLRVRPFIPFRLQLTTGEVFNIEHPELVMVGNRSLVIGLTSGPAPRYDTTRTIALLHVVKLEPLETNLHTGGAA